MLKKYFQIITLLTIAMGFGIAHAGGVDDYLLRENEAKLANAQSTSTVDVNSRTGQVVHGPYQTTHQAFSEALAAANVAGAQHFNQPDREQIDNETICGDMGQPWFNKLSNPIAPYGGGDPNMKRDSCIGNCNACLGACADREDVRLPAGSRVDRAILGNAVYIYYGLVCLPHQILWRAITWKYQKSWNCMEDICAQTNATTFWICRKEPRFGLEVTGLLCSESCNIEKRRLAMLGGCLDPGVCCGGFLVREDRGEFQPASPALDRPTMN